jgi:hypothetical protein
MIDLRRVAGAMVNPARWRRQAGSLPELWADQPVDGFATEAPAGVNPESGELALSKQAVDRRPLRSHRGMQFDQFSKLADRHYFALQRPNLLVPCQLLSFLLDDLPQRRDLSPVHGIVQA